MITNRKCRIGAAALASGLAVAASLVVPGAAGADSSNTVPKAVAALKVLETRPAHIQTTAVIGKPIPKGKTIDWIVCGSPLCTVLTGPLQSAAKSLGWTVDAIPGGLTPETISDAWNLAVQNHPDGVMASGFPDAVFTSALTKLQADKIPVVNGFVTDSPSAGYVPVMSKPTEYSETGQAMADYAIGTGGKSTNAVFVYGSTFPADADVKSGYQSVSSKICPTCGFAALSIPESDVGTTLPSVITAYLRTHPSVNYVILGEGSFEAGVPQALQTAGLANKVKIVGQYPTQASLEDLKSGKISALVMTAQSDAMWEMTDAMARSIVGVSPTPSEGSSPVWVVTKANAHQLTAPYYVTSNYQAQYKKLWGK